MTIYDERDNPEEEVPPGCACLMVLLAAPLVLLGVWLLWVLIDLWL
jgi:hypothetical protein